MRNYKKYRSVVISSFSSFLAGKIDLHELHTELLSVEENIKKDMTDKRVWFKFFNNDTGATGIYELYLDLYRGGNNKKYREECMQLSVDNPKELQIYYS